jgi:hypothetical protein
MQSNQGMTPAKRFSETGIGGYEDSDGEENRVCRCDMQATASVGLGRRGSVRVQVVTRSTIFYIVSAGTTDNLSQIVNLESAISEFPGPVAQLDRATAF